MQRSQGSGGFGGFNTRLTPLAKNTLIGLVAIYVVQIILIHWLHLPIQRWLYLWPVHSGSWMPWQPITSQVLNYDSFSLGVLFDWLMVYFFAGQVERMFTTKKYIKAMAFALGVAAVVTGLLDLAGALANPTTFVGQRAFTIALIAFFGLSIPHAKIMLFPIPIEIKAAWVAWGSGFLALIYFIIGRDLGSSMGLFGWVGAWAWLNGGDTLSKLKNRKKSNDRDKEMSRFTVYQGGRDDDEYIH